MTSRIVSFLAWLCLLATLCVTVVASPVPIDAANSTVTHTEEARELEKRVTRTGRATWFHAGESAFIHNFSLRRVPRVHSWNDSLRSRS